MSDSAVALLQEMKRRKSSGTSFVSQPEKEFSFTAGASPPIIEQHKGSALWLDLSLSDEDEQWEKYDALQKEVLNSEKWMSVGEFKRMKVGASKILADKGQRVKRKRNRRSIDEIANEKCEENGEKSDWCLGQLVEGAGDVTMVSGQHLEESVEAESESRSSRENEQMSNQAQTDKYFEELDKLKVLYEDCSSCQKISIPYLNSYHFKLYQLINSGIKAHICEVCSTASIPKTNLITPATSVTRNSRSSKSLQNSDIPNQRLIGNNLEQNRGKLADKKEFPCSGCSKLFPSKQHATNHAYTHMTKEELDKLGLLGVFYEECPTCSKIFCNRGQFKRHQLIHSGLKSHICGHCSMAFTQKQNLVRHTNVHLNPKEKQKIKSGWKNACYFCDKKFKAPSLLLRHFPIHSKERAFRCNFCPQTFTQQVSLIFHKKSVHQKVRPFLCGDCGKSFARKQHLKNHSFVHSGARPFPCLKCQKTFTQNSHLNAHLQWAHFGVKYKCSECSKSFSTFSHRKRHVNTVHS